MLVNKISEIKKELVGVGKTAILVEGKRDRIPLDWLGFKNIYNVSWKPVYKTVDDIISKGFDSVVILTDYDEVGRRKAKILSSIFVSNGVHVNNLIRQKIKAIFRINKIEELISLKRLFDMSYSPEKEINRNKFLRKH